MDQIVFHTGAKVRYKSQEAIIIKVADLNLVSIQILSSNIIYTVTTKELEPTSMVSEKTIIPIDALNDQEWEKANQRYELIKPFLESKIGFKDIKAFAEKNNIHYTTFYRWIKAFKKTGLITALADNKKTGGKNKSRLDSDIDEIINTTIIEQYLDPSKKSIPKIIRTIIMRCKEKDIQPPHANTIRNRIKNISEEDKLRFRYGRKAAHDRFAPILGNFPGANFPLSIVQIDHTCVDIILVDELFRKPFHRPYLTLAIDVFSRMVVGFHLSFDPPGEMGTGLCVANSILGKDILLEKHGIKGEWPCWGTMATLHFDNAKEFRGNMLKKACSNYGISIEHRPIATPHWGGHIERLLGTFSKEIHNLAGTTFSNINDRDNYDSQEKASLTINEFEKWLITYIVNVYHQRIHSSLNMTPLEKYRQGTLGEFGTGIPPKILNERRVKLDFMPYFERTVQEYGVLIDHICYYDEVLRKYIHAKEDKSAYSKKQKFIFKRDPRDISIVYFLDPGLNEYYEIPYRDTSKPPISIWEFNEVVTKLQKENAHINEDIIFQAYKEMEEIELKAIRETKKLKRFSRLSDRRNTAIHTKEKDDITSQVSSSYKIIEDVKPFEEIDDESFAQ